MSGEIIAALVPVALGVVIGILLARSCLRHGSMPYNREKSLIVGLGARAPDERRDSRWPAIRRAHLNKEPACAVCGSKRGLQVHHILPLSWAGGAEHELDEGNLITLCDVTVHNCHLLWGHLGDFNSVNPFIKKDAQWFRDKMKNRPNKSK